MYQFIITAVLAVPKSIQYSKFAAKIQKKIDICKFLGKNLQTFYLLQVKCCFYLDTISANERRYVERRGLLCGFEFHRDDSTEESREGVVTAALGLGGVGVVVR